MALSLRENAMVILPISLLLGVILGLGRLYHDSEIAAAQACGVGTRTLYLAAGTVTLLATAICRMDQFQGRAGGRRALHPDPPGSPAHRRDARTGAGPVPFAGFRGDAVFRAIRIPMERCVTCSCSIACRTSEQMEIVLADRASYSVSADSSVYQITLVDGESYTGVPGGGAWRTVRFREQVVRVPTPEASLPGKPPVDVLPTSALLNSDDPRLQRRDAVANRLGGHHAGAGPDGRAAGATAAATGAVCARDLGRPAVCGLRKPADRQPDDA